MRTRMTTALRWATATIRRRENACGCRPVLHCGPSTRASACEVSLMQIGSTIAVHTGPYALGLGVMRRWKKQ